MARKGKFLSCWPYLLMTVLVVLIYLPTFWGDFLLDDRPLIQNNPHIKTLQSPIHYLTQEDGITEEFDSSRHHTGYYRPFINLTYAIDYKLWGLSAPGFRTTNLFLHIVCCVILFHFLQYMIGNRYAALAAVLIFAVHPVNTEAVSWSTARNNILVTLFSISSIHFYIRGWEKRGGLMWVASVLTFILAILSKEMGLMVLPLLFIYQRLILHKTQNIREELLSYLPFIITIAAYFLLRKTVITSFITPIQIDDFWQRVCFAPYIILWNLKLIFVPHDLHSFLIGYPSSCLSWQAIAGFCYIGFAGIIIWGVRKNRLMLFSVLSFHLALLPTLNIIPTSGVTLVSMRWLYFSMAFLTIAMAQAVKVLFETNRFVKRGVLCAVLVYLGAYSFILNKSLWKNESRFFRQEVVNFDNHYYAGGLAENLLGQKNYEDAEAFFQLAIQEYPLEARNFLNYSALLIDTGRPGAALVCLKKAENLGMTRTRQGQWFNNMGAAHFQMKHYEEAHKYLRKAVIYCPHKIEFLTNMAGVYIAIGEYQRASSILESALEDAGDSIPLRKNLALTYIRTNRYRDAVELLREIPEAEWKRHGIRSLYEEAKTGVRKRDVHY